MQSTHTTKRITAAAAVALIAALAAPAGADAGVAAIGEPMPDFTLKDYTGETHTLSDYAGSVVVLDFCSQTCPWSRGSDPDFARIAEQYSEKGVLFFGVDSHKDTSSREIREYAAKTGIPFPILKDGQNLYADQVAATRTPEVYILDQSGKLVYHGAFDNRTSPTKTGESNYVTMALDAVLAGETVATPKVSAWGCNIKRVAKKDEMAGSASK